ncbi:MAG: cysteine desulfurase [Firmicutes bacterium]|nr:cysteine desulfurase [Bacillota bacterium]
MEAYLDNSATTRPSSEVTAAILQGLNEVYGNPSSLHHQGFVAEKALKEARQSIASALGATPEEIVFTSGGTEANNLGILGVLPGLGRRGKRVITCRTEHLSVLNVFRHLETKGYQVVYLKVNRLGLIDPAELEAALTADTILASVMLVNNEIGTIQPIAAIAKLLKSSPAGPVFHVDAVQAFGKIDCRVNKLGVDLLTISGHKIHGPKGVGALYVRRGIRLAPLFYGGGQENGLRPGTENLPGILGMGAASQQASANLAANAAKLRELKGQLAGGISRNIRDIRINSPADPIGAPHILNVSFPGLKAEVLLHALARDGIYVSTGSACAAKKGPTSHVLQATGLTGPESAIRFSLSPDNTPEEIDYCLERLQYHVNDLRRFAGKI